MDVFTGIYAQGDCAFEYLWIDEIAELVCASPVAHPHAALFLDPHAAQVGVFTGIYAQDDREYEYLWNEEIAELVGAVAVTTVATRGSRKRMARSPDVDFTVIANEWEGDKLTGRWTPKFEDELTGDDLNNAFMVSLMFQRIQGVQLAHMTFMVHGFESIEDVCFRMISKLRSTGKLGQDTSPRSAIFCTLDVNKMVIPSGTLMAEVFKTNVSDSGVSVELEVFVIGYQIGNSLMISGNHA